MKRHEREAMERVAPGIETWTAGTMVDAHLRPIELAESMWLAARDYQPAEPSERSEIETRRLAGRGRKIVNERIARRPAEPSEAEVEAAAKAIYYAPAYHHGPRQTVWEGDEPGHYEFDRNQYRIMARAALAAAKITRNQGDTP